MIIVLTKIRRILSPNIYKYLRIIFVGIISLIPFNLRLKSFHFFSKNSVFYKNIKKNDIVVQVGAPADLLKQGRSRSLLILLRKPKQLLVIEPDPFSVSVLKEIIKNLDYRKNVKVLSGAISLKKKNSILISNNNHQATNRLYDNNDSYKECNIKKIKVKCKKLTDYFKKIRILPTVLSITTNGGEGNLIDQYLNEVKKKDFPRVISLAPPNDKFLKILKKYNYNFVDYDDRGMTFKNQSINNEG